jgi:hypothetical protein
VWWLWYRLHFYYCWLIDLTKLEKKFLTSTCSEIFNLLSQNWASFLREKNENIETNVPFLFLFFCILVKFRTKKMLPSQGFVLVTNLWRRGADNSPTDLVWRKMHEVATFRGKKEVKLAIFRASVLVTSPVYSGVWNFVFLSSLNSSQIWLSPLAPLATVLGRDFFRLSCLLCPVDFVRKTSGTIAGKKTDTQKAEGTRRLEYRRGRASRRRCLWSLLRCKTPTTTIIVAALAMKILRSRWLDVVVIVFVLLYCIFSFPNCLVRQY